MEKEIIKTAEFNVQAFRTAQKLRELFAEKSVVSVHGVPRGGIPAVYAVAAMWFQRFGNDKGLVIVDSAEQADAFIDDIYDSGKTAKRYETLYGDKPFLALFDKRQAHYANRWLVMPHEVTSEGSDESATDIVTRLLEFIGEDPSREGLRETPRRFIKAWREWASGYCQDPKTMLKAFEDGADGVNEMVIVHNIPLFSKCEHHLADITGVAHVGYIPNGKIVGLSKLARITDCFARRLQVQERLTNQIADLLWKELNPVGVGVLIRASHGCMSSRGVKIHGSLTTTSAMRGALMEKPEARAEFLSLCGQAERNRGNSF